MIRRPPRSTLLSLHDALPISLKATRGALGSRYSRRGCSPQSRPTVWALGAYARDRKSTRLNSSHGYISYAVFCLKKKKDNTPILLRITQLTLPHDLVDDHSRQ